VRSYTPPPLLLCPAVASRSGGLLVVASRRSGLPALWPPGSRPTHCLEERADRQPRRLYVHDPEASMLQASSTPLLVHARTVGVEQNTLAMTLTEVEGNKCAGYIQRPGQPGGCLTLASSSLRPVVHKPQQGGATATSGAPQQHRGRCSNKGGAAATQGALQQQRGCRSNEGGATATKGGAAATKGAPQQ
jgi:hypothetical protein